jgi:amidohydrolase
MNLVEAKQYAIKHIDKLQDDLWHLVTKLYENPEVAFEEYHASALISDILTKAGFEVEAGTGGIETAFQGIKHGDGGGPTIAFLAEYDALPEIGHACGHNLIAAAAVGAGLGLKPVLEDIPGDLRVIGTPAEEGGGGKRIMVEAGVFEEIDAAMMFHPASKNMVTRGSLASMRLKVEFFGKTAHAAASPQEGINALDAMILTFNSINAIRQHLETKDRIAGIITHGGDAANIIPGYTSAEFSVRGESENRRAEVLEKVIACAEAAALATGCRLNYETNPGYSEIYPNPTLAKLFSENLITIGREVIEPDPLERMGSTDMGNVSKVVPAIHPYLETVPEEIAGHTVEFREVCMTETGKAAMLDAAKAMAMTAVDLLFNPSLLSTARTELDLYLNSE